MPFDAQGNQLVVGQEVLVRATVLRVDHTGRVELQTGRTTAYEVNAKEINPLSSEHPVLREGENVISKVTGRHGRVKGSKMVNGQWRVLVGFQGSVNSKKDSYTLTAPGNLLRDPIFTANKKKQVEEPEYEPVPVGGGCGCVDNDFCSPENYAGSEAPGPQTAPAS